jgi:hypothetical protein
MRLDRAITRRTATDVPFRYDLYCWLSHLAVVVLDPILYLLGYCCVPDCDASCRRLKWGINARRAARGESPLHRIPTVGK